MSTTTADDRPALEARGIRAGYGQVNVLQEIDLYVDRGEIVALLGRNGAGKSTTLKALSGLIPVRAGTVLLAGDVRSDSSASRARDGLAYVVEERGVLLGLTAAQNLKLGRGSIDSALEYFPELKPHLRRTAGLLSGGQQQMLAVARALAGSPRALMIDELSLGLAPQFVERLFLALQTARTSGVGILLVEQHARSALRIADRAYVLNGGRVTLTGTAANLADDFEAVEAAYLGAGG